MSNVVALQKKAQEIADRALAETRADESVSLSLSEAIAALHEHAEKAQRTYNGRELMLFEADLPKIGRLVDALVAGNYRETAATLAGITSRSLRNWMEAAEQGDRRYEAIAHVVRIAEALAESASVRNVRAAGNDPRFWAADMTYLERKYPDRWGRRQEESNAPRVIVQIGVKDSDVQIQLSSDGTPAPLRETIRAELRSGLQRDDAIARFGERAGWIYDEEFQRRGHHSDSTE